MCVLIAATNEDLFADGGDGGAFRSCTLRVSCLQILLEIDTIGRGA